MNWEGAVPQSWRSVSLRDVLAEPLTNGRSVPTSESGFPVLRLTALRDGRIDLAERKVGSWTADEARRFQVSPGDVLVSRGNGSLHLVGRAGLVDAVTEPVAFPDTLIRIRLDARLVDSRFFVAMWNGGTVRQQLERTAKTTAGIYKVSQGNLQAVGLVLPPIDEQRRIVAKLEVLQTRSRRARDALDAVPPLLAKLRQSILAAAFRGELTKDWRAKHKDVEPASKLLERIRVERRRKWEEGEFAKLKAKGKAPKGDDWKARYKEPEPVEANGLSGLPKGWCWASIDELCPGDAPAVYGIILPGDDVAGGVPYMRPVDMQEDNTVDFDSIKRTTTEIASQYARASLRTGDVVLSIVGTIGKVVIVPPELDGGNITQSSARIRLPPGMAPEYMALALKSPALTRQFDAFRFGNAVQRLNVEHVRRLGIPLAPKDEQAAIVQRAQFALGSIPGVLLAELKEQAAVLDRAVLAKAFRGELVPQDPNDEPAQEMLSRVHAQAEATNSDDAPKSKRARKSANGRR